MDAYKGLVLHNTLLLPNFHVNLVSVGRTAQRGIVVTFDNEGVTFVNAASQLLVATGRRSDSNRHLYQLNITAPYSPITADITLFTAHCMKTSGVVSSSGMTEADRLQAVTGHAGTPSLARTLKLKQAAGLTSASGIASPCAPCALFQVQGHVQQVCSPCACEQLRSARLHGPVVQVSYHQGRLPVRMSVRG